MVVDAEHMGTIDVPQRVRPCGTVNGTVLVIQSRTRRRHFRYRSWPETKTVGLPLGCTAERLAHVTDRPATGTIVWFDLTVSDAPGIRDFYASVIGWRPEPLSVGDYDDFVMQATSSGDGVAGVCHARGENANLPPQWIAYIAVDDLDASLEHCDTAGGKRLSEVRGSAESGRYCVIQDPAGAVLALMQMGTG